MVQESILRFLARFTGAVLLGSVVLSARTVDAVDWMNDVSAVAAQAITTIATPADDLVLASGNGSGGRERRPDGPAKPYLSIPFANRASPARTPGWPGLHSFGARWHHSVPKRT